MQYRTVVGWDLDIVDCELGSDGLVVRASKKTVGVPTAVAGVYAPGALVQSKGAGGVLYQNTGTTASPVFTVNSTT
jgi:hypothetical protein